MSPAPSARNRRLSMEMAGILYNFFKLNSCNLFAAPFDVRLLDKKKSTLDQEIYTVIQPDLCIICDDAKIDERGAIGAPDLVIEILSPGNSNNEMKYKFDLYEEAGVLEYWIVNPADKTVFIYVLKENEFIGMHPMIEEDSIQSKLFPELDFKLESILS